MTPDQRMLVHGLVISPPSGNINVTKEEFALKFPESLENGKLCLNMLSKVYMEKSAEDLQNALIIGHIFGFPAEAGDILFQLVGENWHFSHEDVVSAIAQCGFFDQRACDALYNATEVMLPYLEYDVSRALAVKAIWALGKIPGNYSEQKLSALAQSTVPVICKAAENQLRRRLGT